MEIRASFCLTCTVSFEWSISLYQNAMYVLAVVRRGPDVAAAFGTTCCPIQPALFPTLCSSSSARVSRPWLPAGCVPSPRLRSAFTSSDECMGRALHCRRSPLLLQSADWRILVGEAGRLPAKAERWDWCGHWGQAERATRGESFRRAQDAAR